MTDLIIVAILAVIIVAAGRYIYKSKKSGAKCIGCSVEGGCCSGKSGADASGCGCGCSGEMSTCACHTDNK